MDWKKILIRLAFLFPISFLGGTLFAVCVNAFVYFNMVPQEAANGGEYGQTLVTRAAYVWMGAILVGLASIFIKGNWRYVFYFAPLYSPSAYAIFHTLNLR